MKAKMPACHQDAMFEMFREMAMEKADDAAMEIPNDLKLVVEKYERQHIMDALEQYEYNQTKASRRLGIKRTTLIAKMKKFNILC
jgi:DNA-binding NtrC family response regulator